MANTVFNEVPLSEDLDKRQLFSQAPGRIITSKGLPYRLQFLI